MNLQLFALKDKVIIMADDGGGSPTKKEEKKTTNTTKVGGFDPNSLVDYLKMNGEDSSYSARAVIADELGIANYKGSGDQNTQLLKMLKEGNKPSTPATNVDTKPSKQDKPAVTDPVVTAPTTNNTVTAPVITAPPLTSSSLQGVDGSLINTLNSAFAPSANVAGAQSNANNALDILTGMQSPSVSKELMDKLNSQFNASSNLTGAQQNANNALDILTGMSAPSVSADVMQALNTPFNASSAYLEAMNYTNSLLEKLSSGRTSYTDQIKDMMSQIQNRDKFSYDVNTDTLFQQALASAMGSGKQAMQDTMGQASALTGGYASTYAQSAGNQAYNAYIEDAYNNLPEYYQMALEAYNMEGQEMYNQLAMLNDADATEYGRMYDSWNANFTNAQNMYNQEYGAWQDSVNNAYNNANLQLKQQGMAIDQAYNNYNALANNATNLYNQEYGAWQDSVNNAYNSANLQLKEQGMAYDQAYTNYNALSNQAQTLYQNEYTKWQDMVNNAYSIAQIQNKDYWSGVDNQYRYDVMENNNAQAQLDREQEDKWNQAELDYKNSIATQNQNNWLAQNDINGDGVVDANDQKVDAEEEYSTPKQGMYTEALEAYNTGGEAGLMTYLETLPDYDVNTLYDYALDHGTVAPEASTYTKVKDTTNWLGGVDRNDVVVNVNTGEESKIKDLPKDIQKELTDLKEGETYDFSTGTKVNKEAEEKKKKEEEAKKKEEEEKKKKQANYSKTSSGGIGKSAVKVSIF